MSIYVLCIEENAFYYQRRVLNLKATIEMLSHAPGDMQWLTIFKNNDIVKEINLDVFRCKMSTYEEK